MFFLWYLLIGLVTGAVAALITRRGGAGTILNLVAGIGGGMFGGWLVVRLGWFWPEAIGAFISAFVGAVILIWLVWLAMRQRPTQSM